MVSFRTAGLPDAPAVLTFWALAAENDARPADTSAAVENLIRRDPHAMILAIETAGEPQERIVGTVIAGFDGWRGHLYRLAVAPDKRRRGIGAALLQRAEQRLAALGATRADAMVLDTNPLGRQVWAAQSYKAQDTWSRWVKPLV